MRSGDERILSRHLASGQQSTFRGADQQQQQQQTNAEQFGSLLDPAQHPRRAPMANFSSSPFLRRSMPAVNMATAQGQQQVRDGNEHGEEEKGMEAAGQTNRHRSFGASQPAEGEGGSWSSTWSPSAMPRNFDGTSSLSAANIMAMASSSSCAVDTRQIQVFLKKREDSRATINTTLSDTTDCGSASAIRSGGPIPGIPPAPPAPSSSSTPASSSTNVQLRNARKVFRSADTRSSIFSVSSSLDSNKEERIISSLEHTPAASSRVVVLPRPHALMPSHSLQVDPQLQHYGYGTLAEEGAEGSSTAAERIRSSSAELPRQLSPSASAGEPAGTTRRTSIDAKTPVGNGNESPASLSSWHSVSELNSARHSDCSERQQQLMKEAEGLGHRRPATGAPSDWPPRPQSQASHRRSNYLGELVWQVDETVYCGGIEAAQNQNLLCRLNIEYIVDLSGQEDDPSLANSRPRTEYPCLCPKRTAHSRMTMSIRIKDDSPQMLNRDTRPSIVDTKVQLQEREEIIHYFEALIDLIRKARISQKKVLIHSLKGRNRAPAFVAAYLMHCNRQTRVQAINKITKMMSSMRPGTCISDSLQRALMRWQSMLGIRAESSRLDSQQLNKMFAVKKSAWN